MHTSTNKDKLVLPTVPQQAWHDMELGMFFHFDIPIYKQGWDWRSWRDLPDPNLYQPHNLDTDQWLEAAKAMGAKYAVFVAKHCSGFCQWQTDIYPYGVRQSSWRNGKGDVVADFVRSCGKYGIKPGLYASVSANGYLEVENPGIINRGKGGNPERQAEYVRMCEQMITELWSRYGDLFEVWFDGGAIPVEQGGPDLVSLMHKYQPDAIAFQGPPGTPNPVRWVGNERGTAPYPCWSTTDSGTAEDGATEKTYAGRPNGTLWAPGECDVPVRNHNWVWAPGEEDRLFSLDQLMEMYCCSVGRNCNLLLNANPGPDGLVPKADFQRHAEFGNEIRRRFSTHLASTQGEGSVIELDLARPRKINHVIVMEDIAHGERTLDYVVEGRVQADAWQTLCSGECIGHKRIQQFATVEATHIRLRVAKAKATPHIRQLTAYLV